MTNGRSHGPLPVLLVALTVVTGLVDAFSYLSLGHVFVANMTGNVVFLGFGLAGAAPVVACWLSPPRSRQDLSSPPRSSPTLGELGNQRLG